MAWVLRQTSQPRTAKAIAKIAITAKKTGAPARTLAGLIYDAQGVTYESPPIPLTIGYQAAIVPRPIASYGGYWTMDQINSIAVGIKLVG